MERGGNTGWLLIAAQWGRRVFSADVCALHIGSFTPGDFLSDKAELSAGPRQSQVRALSPRLQKEVEQWH